MTQARQFGHYELISRLGRGGMGEVWRAKHRMLNRQAAVKLIRPDALATEAEADVEVLLRRFEREDQHLSTTRCRSWIFVVCRSCPSEPTWRHPAEDRTGHCIGAFLDLVLHLFGTDLHIPQLDQNE